MAVSDVSQHPEQPVGTWTSDALGLPPGLSQELAERVAARMEVVERHLRDAVANADPLADAASGHLVAAGGKRLRPMLTLLTAELGDARQPEVLDAAVVVELTHLATLYHDDVMDSAPLRRGAPSAHAVWGNSVAILTGDVLFARASVIVAGLGPDAVRAQARTFERLCLGQLHELTGPAEGADAVDFYLGVLADKTASLLATAARFGAQFSGCSPEIVETVARYGERLGVAFQLADDIIDLTSPTGVTGKTPGTDLREQVTTMPVLLLRTVVAQARATGRDDVQAQRDAALLARIDGDLSDDGALAEVVAELREHAVVAETRNRALVAAKEAAAELADVPDGPVKDALIEFSRLLVDRTA